MKFDLSRTLLLILGVASMSIAIRYDSFILAGISGAFLFFYVSLQDKAYKDFTYRGKEKSQ